MVERPAWDFPTPASPNEQSFPDASTAVTVARPGAVLSAAEVMQQPDVAVAGGAITSSPAADGTKGLDVHGVDPELRKEMTSTVEGYEANLQEAASSAAKLEQELAGFGVSADAFNAEFRKLPSAMRS